MLAITVKDNTAISELFAVAQKPNICTEAISYQASFMYVMCTGAELMNIDLRHTLLYNWNVLMEDQGKIIDSCCVASLTLLSIRGILDYRPS